MKLNVMIAQARQCARGDVYQEDEIGNVACPNCWQCAQQAKFLHRLWHRIYLDHQIDCGECGVVHRRRTKLGRIDGFKRWTAATKHSRALAMKYRSHGPKTVAQK